MREKVKIFHPIFREMMQKEMEKKGMYRSICKDMADYYYGIWKEDERNVTALMNMPVFYLKAGDEVLGVSYCLTEIVPGTISPIT